MGGGLRFVIIRSFDFLSSEPSVIPILAPNQTQLARFHAEFFRHSALFSRSNRFYTQFILRILTIWETINLNS